MRFKRIEIKNYRSLEDATVDLDGLTILIGANNAGKTTILDAIELFGGSGREVGAVDFNDRGKDVEITLTIACQKGELGTAGRFCIKGELVVKKTYSLSGDKVTLDHSAKALFNPDFENLKNCVSVSDIRHEIKRLSPRYHNLPVCSKSTKRGKWMEKLEKYEQGVCLARPNDPRVQRRFVPWNELEAQLETLVDIVHVPSMRDITNDGEEGSDSYLAKLVSMAIEDAQNNDSELINMAKARLADYDSYVRVFKNNVIRGINASLAKNSGHYVKDSAIAREITPPEQVLPRPVSSVVINEGGRETSMGQAGGGTRRVYLMALLETISELRGRALGMKRGARAKLLMIDEPELYQHPQRQRQMLRTLVELSSAGKDSVQVICSTHSPYFIDLGQVSSLRLVQKGRPTRILRTTLDSLMGHFPRPKSRPENGTDELRTWLDMNSSHLVTEGFFSRTAVVLEGPGDRNMLLATASAMGVNLDQYEMSLVPANGKCKIPHLVHIFSPFEIPVYPIWDLDYKPGISATSSQRDLNKLIIKLVSASRFPKYANLEKTEINNKFSCFEDNMTASLAQDLERCKKLLAGMGEYEELQSAKRADKDASGQNAYMHDQKHVLNSRETVFKMLKTIQGKDPQKLKHFSTVKVVRKLEEIGKKNAMAN